MAAVSERDYLEAQPPERHEPGALEAIRERIDAGGRPFAVIDDDPTGTQCVHGVPVLTTWEEDDLAAAMNGPSSTFFVLTNSRSMPPDEAEKVNRDIGQRLGRHAPPAGVAVASRSDSILRGHFPLETDTLAAALAETTGRAVDGVVVCPAFFEAGRLTIDDVHWVRIGNELWPAGETEFARDESFGFSSSNLAEWVEEKTGGRWPASEVARVGLADVREGGPERVRELLSGISGGRPVIVNATGYADLEVFMIGLLDVEAQGTSFVYRTGPSFQRTRGGISESAPLQAEELYAKRPARGRGLVVLGSYVGASTRQFERLLALPEVETVELSVAAVLDDERRDAHVAEVAARAVDLLGSADVVVYTSREEVRGDAARTGFGVKQAVADALVDVVRAVPEDAPLAWVMGKGGITSSDVGIKGLGVRQAEVAGQLFTGLVSVWILPEEARFPGLPYVVFPGNVGGPDSLAEAVERLRGGRG